METCGISPFGNDVNLSLLYQDMCRLLVTVLWSDVIPIQQGSRGQHVIHLGPTVMQRRSWVWIRFECCNSMGNLRSSVTLGNIYNWSFNIRAYDLTCLSLRRVVRTYVSFINFQAMNLPYRNTSFVLLYLSKRIEGIKTTSMEDVSTRVLEKIKNI